MLQPKKTEYSKVQKGRNRGVAVRGCDLCYGDFGFKALENGEITAKQIEAIRIMISKVLGKSGKMYIRIFPDKPKTKKPLGVRMGSGKGNFECYVAVIKAGMILFEVCNVNKDEVYKLVKLIDAKLPFKVTIVEKNNFLY